jgi:hypothetical protein
MSWKWPSFTRPPTTPPAHKHDIHAAMIESDELEIFTGSGGQRRKANTIGVGDTIKLKSQRSFFSILFDPGKTPATKKP